MELFATDLSSRLIVPADEQSVGTGGHIEFSNGECALGEILIARSSTGICAILFGLNVGELEEDLAARFPDRRLIRNERGLRDDLFARSSTRAKAEAIHIPFAAVDRFAALAMTNPAPLHHPEYREPEDQQHQEDHDEDIEQEAGDVGGSRRNAGKAEDSGDNGYQEEDQRPSEYCHFSLRSGPSQLMAALFDFVDLTASPGYRFP